jgi:serine/threonine protein kinase
MNARLVGDPIAPRIRNSHVSPEAEEIILHAMEREPSDRYQSAAEMKADLDQPEQVSLTGRHERLRPHSHWRARWRMLRTTLLLLLVPVFVFGFLFWAFYRLSPQPVPGSSQQRPPVHRTTK